MKIRDNDIIILIEYFDVKNGYQSFGYISQNPIQSGSKFFTDLGSLPKTDNDYFIIEYSTRALNKLLNNKFTHAIAKVLIRWEK